MRSEGSSCAADRRCQRLRAYASQSLRGQEARLYGVAAVVSAREARGEEGRGVQRLRARARHSTERQRGTART